MGETAAGKDPGPVSTARRWRAADLWAAAAVAALALLTFFRFPGHTFLQADTQIYMPILERLWDPQALPQELLAADPHVSFTIYDETALALRRLTGLDFRHVLQAEQLVFRALGIFGVYLLARALRLSRRLALLAAAAFSLGAVITGPTVLSIEYEPVPRGFAVPLVMLAAGLAANGRDVLAGTAVAVAFLYHPPTVIPFWIVYFCLTLWPSKPELMRRRILGLIPILAGVVVLIALARLQAGMREPQPFFSRIEPWLEQLQKLRAPYNWVTLWPAGAIAYYAVLWLASLAAFWRVREWASQDLRFIVIGLPLIGMLSLPLSYLLLDRLKWILVPQVQPMRALLFVPVFTGLLAAAAAVRAGERRRWWECALWLLLVFAIPFQPRLKEHLPQALLLAAASSGALWVESRRRRWAPPALAAAALLAFLAAGPWEKSLRTPDLAELEQWARSNTAPDAVYLFPDAGKEVYPGIFRAEALRAVYVDWKGGGQVNFLPQFAREWWIRWQRAGRGRFVRSDAAHYRSWGIDYFVVKRRHARAGAKPAFENATFVVYKTA